MTDRPDDAAPKSRRKAAARGSALPSREVPAPEAGTAAGQPAAAPIESTLVGKDGDRPAMTPRTGAKARGAAADAALADKAEVSPVVLTAEGAGKRDATPFLSGDEAGRETLSDAAPHPAPSASTIPSVARRDEPAATASPAQPAATRQRRGGFAPLFLGGVVAAGLGAGAAWWAVPHLPPAWQPAAPAPAVDTAALTATVESRAVEAATQAADASLAAQGETLIQQARQAGADAAAQLLAEAPAGPGPDPSVQTALAAQARQLAALDEALRQLRTAPAATTTDLAPVQQALDAQAAQVQALEGAVAALRDAPPVDLAPIQAQLAELAQRPVVDSAAIDRLNALAAEAEAATERIAAAASQAEARLAEAETRAAALAASADEAARRAQAASAAAAIGEAIQSGASREAALTRLAEAGVTPPPALTAEVPTLDRLVADFPAAARAAVRAALQAESAQGQGSVVGNFLRAQTGARSVKPREGNDADAVLSRAGEAVERGNIPAALDELSALPEAARPAMEAWTAQAQAYADAQAALGALVAPAAAPQAETPADPAATNAPAPAAEPTAPASATTPAESIPPITPTDPTRQPDPPPASADAAAPSN